MKHGHGSKKKVVLSQYQKQLNALGCPTGKNGQNGKNLKRFKKRRRAYLREVRRKFA